MIRELQHADAEALEQLTDVLVDCVEGGASVSFMLPLEREHARDFWRRAAHDAEAQRRVLLVARDAQGLCGTVQLILDLPDNQPHRADVAKMLVHRRARRRGSTKGWAGHARATSHVMPCGRAVASSARPSTTGTCRRSRPRQT